MKQHFIFFCLSFNIMENSKCWIVLQLGGVDSVSVCCITIRWDLMLSKKEREALTFVPLHLCHSLRMTGKMKNPQHLRSFSRFQEFSFLFLMQFTFYFKRNYGKAKLQQLRISTIILKITLPAKEPQHALKSNFNLWSEFHRLQNV